MGKRKENRRVWPRVKRFFIIFICIFAVLLLISPPLAIRFLTQKHVDYAGSSVRNTMQEIYEPEDFDLNATEMLLITEDGVEIWASEIFVTNPKAIIIYLSGILQPSVTYFYGHSKWMEKHGYASILLEVRGHGNSKGERICLGYEEVSDVKAVVAYIKKEEKYKDTPIVVQGLSMGGAVAINAFGCIDEVDGLIAMSAYSSFEDVVCDTMRGYQIPYFICKIEKTIIRSYLKVLYGDKVDVIKPVKQIQNIGDRYALLIACTGDTKVPPINMYRLLEHSTENIESWLRESKEHLILRNRDFINVEKDEEYCARIISFLETKIVKK